MKIKIVYSSKDNGEHKHSGKSIVYIQHRYGTITVFGKCQLVTKTYKEVSLRDQRDRLTSEIRKEQWSYYIETVESRKIGDLLSNTLYNINLG